MKSIPRSIMLFLFVLFPVICMAGKELKYTLPEAYPTQQWEHINNLLTEAKSRMDNHDYQAAQALLAERCEMLDMFYEKNGTSTADSQKTGYEYMTIVPKLYCNLRIGRVGDNLREISHLREQYHKLFKEQHPQDDLLETEVAETYFRMGNIGMAIETAEKQVSRLHADSKQSTVAYHKIYYRLMAYYKSIGREDTPYFSNFYKPENEISDTWELYTHLYDDNLTFQQKMTTFVKNIAKLIDEGENNDARDVIQLGMRLLDKEFPLTLRNTDPEKEHRYNLLKAQLMTLKSKTYKYFIYPNSETEEHLLETYKLMKKQFGENSNEVVDAAEGLAEYYCDAEDNNEEAIKYYQECYSILKSSEEYRKGQLIDIIGAMMQCYADMDEPKAVATFAKQLIAATKDMVVASFGVSSSAERAAIWDKYNHWLLSDIPKLALKFEGKVELGSELYDIALFSKGLLMLSDNTMTELVMKKGDSELKEEGRKLHDLRLKLHRHLTSSYLSELIYANDVRREIEDVEHSLVAKVNKLGNWQHGLNISWQDIQKQLKKGETAIEFLEFDGGIWEDGAIIAVILSSDSYCPIMRKFCESDDLEYSKYFTHCQTTDFYNQYWNNIESDLKETHTVFFSPIGVLNTIPLEYCPIDNEKSLFDKYNMYRLTSTRKILERYISKNKLSSAYLFGGIDYTPDLLKIHKTNVQLKSEGYIANDTNGNTSYEDWEYESSNITNQTSLKGIYQTTLASTLLLSEQLSMMQCKTHTFSDFRATEECFKGMSSESIDILYINTHGFTHSKSVNSRSYSYTYKNDWINVSESEMSMTRSGLLLTGASMAYSPTKRRLGLEDGVITAAEIAQLNLKNVKLVYLSACETGLGEITPEGVLGLQRGFKRAGAHSLITTLGVVNATTSLYFDSTFFTHLMCDSNGKKKKVQSIHDAFTSSVKKLRDAYKEPKYWCVNVLIDALD